MKRITICVLAVILMSLSFSCKTTSGSASGSSSGSTTLDKFNIFASADSRADKSDMIANIDDFEIGLSSMSLNKLFGGLEIKDAVVRLEPRVNAVVLDFVTQGSMFKLSLKKDARAAIIDAALRYNDDFEQKRLEKKGAKRNVVYGTVASDLSWGVLSLLSNNAKAKPVLKLGYTFVNDAPYFTITIPESDNILLGSDSDYMVKKSITLTLHYTRAQAEKLVELISPENIADEIAAKNVPEDLLPEGQAELNAPDVY